MTIDEKIDRIQWEYRQLWRGRGRVRPKVGTKHRKPSKRLGYTLIHQSRYKALESIIDKKLKRR